MKDKKCEYDCGQDALYQLKNGKYCCSKSWNSCPEIRRKNSEGVKKNMQLASDNKYNINSEASLIELANAYGSFPDYQNLAPIFEKLIAINPNNAEYKSTLNLIYSKLGK